MKQTDKEQIERERGRIRLRMLITYFGKSNHLTVAAEVNGRPGHPIGMSDAQLIIAHQILTAVERMVTDELVERDLLPRQVKDPPTPEEMERLKEMFGLQGGGELSKSEES